MTRLITGRVIAFTGHLWYSFAGVGASAVVRIIYITCWRIFVNLNLKERAKQLKIDIPAVFLALGAKETPMIAKILAGIVIIYALSPIDLIPDFIPVLGYLDDIIILPSLIALTVRLIPPDMFAEYRIRAEGLWATGKPKRLYFALPILTIWLIVIFLVIRAIWFH